MSLKTRSYDKELLDGDDIPFGDLLVNLSELNTIGSLLGGHNVTRRGVDFFLRKVPATKSLTIAEIGCGGGDNLFAIQKYLGKKRRLVSLIGIDIKPDCIKYAQASASNIQWICSDYRTVEWPGDKPDIIFSSLFCHHFTDEELVSQINWLKENSKVGFFINDLHRHPLAYHSITLLTRLFSKSYLVKNDAPLSVKRSFKKKDWAGIFSGAGITGYGIKWHWAFRFLICVHHEQ
jgi:SAM-dependent methyltransferase